MRDVAAECGLSFTIISKVENGRPCRWETVHILLTAGLGVKPGADDYKDVKEAWMRQREVIGESMPISAMKYKVSKDCMALVKEIRELVRDMNADEVEVIRGALLRAVVKVRKARL